MLPATILAKKRDGQALTDAEIRFLVDGFCSDKVADYQMAARRDQCLDSGDGAQR